MDQGNQSTVANFILLGFSRQQGLQTLLFLLFLLFYSFCLVGNTLIMIIIRIDAHLHNPMYFFLCNFSLLDILYPSVVVPRMLHDLVSEKKTISYAGCMAQVFFYIFFVSSECFMLTLMATDRYVAICQPLKYHAVMNHGICLQLAVGSWLSACLNSLMHTVAMTRLTFCASNEINHFYCDLQPLLLLSCSDITINISLIYISVVIMGLANSTATVISYAHIISATLKIRSKEGRVKSFSTCGSHLMVLTLFYGTLIVTYFRPVSSYTQSMDRTASIIYTLITPMLNPMIYSLRNKDVKEAIKRLFRKTASRNAQ